MLGGRFEGSVAVHDEVSGTLVLAAPDTGAVLTLEAHRIMEAVRESFNKIVAATQVSLLADFLSRS